MKNHFVIIILISVFLILNSFCFAQNKNIDSLQSLIKKDKLDTNRVIHSYQLCSEYTNTGIYDSALYYGNAALQLALQLNFKKGVANSYNKIGVTNYYQGYYPNALDNYLNALKINEELKDKIGISGGLGNIGIIYKEQGNYPKALDYYFRALKIAEELGNKNIIVAWLGNMGTFYDDQKDYSKALDYYFKALKMSEELGDNNRIATQLNNIGSVYDYQADYSKSKKYYSKALKLAEDFGYKQMQTNILINIGGSYQNQRNYPQALDYYFRALKIAEELGDKSRIAIQFSNLGSIYTITGKFKDAEQYLKRAIIMDDSLGFIDYLSQTEELLSRLYDTIGKHKQALIHYKKAIALKDTLFNQENKKQLVRKEMNYEFEKKEAITRAENEKQQAIAEEKNRKQKIITWSVGGGLLLVLLFAGFIFRSLRITRKQKQIIEIKNTETEHQKKIIEEKNKDITDSIRYAKRIQDALLREEEHISLHLPEHFILFLPKDIVSGDFYWGAEKQGFWYFAAVDCTGHGVPGAIMSMLGISFLNDIVSSEELLSPAEILERLRDKVVKELRQKGEAGGSKDGMDISLCRLELLSPNGEGPWVRLQWAGANNSLNLIRNGKLEEVKPDKQPIGYHPEQYPFTNHELQLQKGDCIYIYSDGYADQFGGANGKKFKYKQLEDLILVNKNLPMKEQKGILKNKFSEWKGSLEQVDDVTIFGIRI